MPMSLGCKELGMECPFVAEGETEQIIIDLFIPHVQTEHDGNWFEILKFYQAAYRVLRKKVA